MSSEKGFLYIAVGDEFLNEALISAKNLSEIMPEYPIKLVTHEEVDKQFIDEVEVVEELDQCSEKPLNMHIPYEKTIFLDMDTIVDSRIDELFELLDEFDLALSHNTTKYYDRNKSVPEGFPQHNTGVMALKNNQTTRDLLSKWKEIYDCSDELDQTSFRKALYESDCRFTVLPAEYNCRFNRMGFLDGEVKVFHGRLTDIDKGFEKRVDVETAIEKINAFTGKRCYMTTLGEIKFLRRKISITKAVFRSVKRYGLLETCKKAIKKISEISNGKWRI